MHEGSSSDAAQTPRSLQRPRSRNRFVDLFLDAAFSFTGPAQVSRDEEPPRGPRTEEEARAGYAQWERVTRGGHTYLVERRVPAEDPGEPAGPGEPGEPGSSSTSSS
ncbi:hypothetical protein FHR75_001955 [Kineococcus radiotolerans]|uniref:Uncharacterized protein n=1 Tax=Kineococcus radiotolerans TaxID=131568 RepID=A0A7W4TMF6_KINRA|nr:hypothetical protein [Kineococcus radiotolerans]MBB2901167.1 hypothetical protein [Kineococcus radiotolerans]